MSNTNHDFIVKNGLVVGSAITSTGTLTQAGQTFPASDGSANQYLKTNGSGALSWGTVNTSFNITDGTTTDAVGLTETVTFTGGTNISLAVTDNTVTITNDVTDTDDITEGSSNLFYTDTRAVDAVEGHAHLTIDGGTLYVDTANNYVGIGDTSPSGKLDVAGNIMINGSEVINASGNIVGAVADSAMTVGGSLAGVLSNLKVQYGTAYSGTPIQGSFFFDSLNQKLKVYTGSAFIDAVPAGSGGGGGGGATDANTTFRNYSYTLTGTTSAVSGVDDNELTAGAFIIGHKYTITATGNTNFVTIGAANSNVNTVFTATGVGTGTGTAKQTLFYDTTSSATRVVAYVNGIKQVYGSGRDFVATTGTSVAFTYNLGSGDTVDLQVYELLTNDAYYVKSEVYTQTEVNSQISTGVSSYLPLTGGVLTDDLAINNGSPELYFGTTGNHYNWRIAAQEAVDTAFEISVGSQDTDYSNDTYTPKLVVKANGNVGIGLTAPRSFLDVKINTNRSLNVRQSADAPAGTGLASIDPVSGNMRDMSIEGEEVHLSTGGSGGSSTISRLTVLAGGNVIVGGTSQISTSGFSVYGDQGIATTRVGSSDFIKMLVGSGGESRIDTANASRVMEVPSSGSEVVFNQGSLDRDFRVESDNNTHMLFVDAGGNQVKINTTSTTAPSSVDLVAGGGIHASYASDIALSYRAGTYSNYYKGMSGKNPYNDVGRGLHIFNYDNDSDTGINFWSGSSESSSLYSIANFEAGATGEVVFNGSGLNRDFRVESDSNSHALWVDADAERLLIGKSNNALGAAGHTFGLDGYLYHTRNGDIMWLNCLASSGTAITFMQNSATKGSITVNSTATTYNTTSDRRLKDNIKPISDATDKLMDMKPVTHTWIDNPDEPQVHGFIAQEMQDVIPEAVSGDAESDEMMSMDYGRITPVIVAALQDALKEIEELKTRIDELENK